MTTTPADTAPATAAGRARIGKALLWIAAAAAGGAALTAISAVLGADGATKIVETWRMCGLVVFTGLFALLALRPLQYRGVWELVLFNKLALTVTALAYTAYGGISGTASIVVWDGGLSVLLIAAYVCCRGWTADPRLIRAQMTAGPQQMRSASMGSAVAASGAQTASSSAGHARPGHSASEPYATIRRSGRCPQELRNRPRSDLQDGST